MKLVILAAHTHLRYAPDQLDCRGALIKQARDAFGGHAALSHAEYEREFRTGGASSGDQLTIAAIHDATLFAP